MMFRLAMYYLSFLPLWISIIFIDVVECIQDDHNLWTENISIAMIVVGLIGAGFTVYRWIRKGKRQNREKYIVENIKEERFGAAEFLMSIVLPLFAFDFTKWDGAVLFVFFFSVFGFITIRHNYFCTNLALEIFGYRVYECQMKSGGQSIVKKIVSRTKLAKGDKICTKKFNNDVHFVVEVNKKGDEADG